MQLNHKKAPRNVAFRSLFCDKNLIGQNEMPAEA